MKFSRLAWLACFLLTVGLVSACSSVKTRKEAAEEARLKATSDQYTPGPITPINDEDQEEYNSSPTVTTEADDDQVLNDELSAMGIDPNNPSGKQTGTPEPEVQSTSPVRKSKSAAETPKKSAPKPAGKGSPKSSEKSEKTSAGKKPASVGKSVTKKSKTKPTSKKIAAKKSDKKKPKKKPLPKSTRDDET